MKCTLGPMFFSVTVSGRGWPRGFGQNARGLRLSKILLSSPTRFSLDGSDIPLLSWPLLVSRYSQPGCVGTESASGSSGDRGWDETWPRGLSIPKALGEHGTWRVLV